MRGLLAAASGLVAPVAFAAVAAAAAVFAAGTATVRVQSAVQWGMQSCSNASSVVRERGALLYTICDGWFVLTPAAVRCIIRMRMDTYMYYQDTCTCTCFYKFMDDDLPPGINLPRRASPSTLTHSASQLPANQTASRCWPDIDTTPTRGDLIGGSWICVAWANGCCAHGSECIRLHRPPTLVEEQRLIYSSEGVTHDVFGRERAALPTAVSAAVDALTNSTIWIQARHALRPTACVLAIA